MILQPRDLLILEVLQRHGPLSSLYLYQFTKPLAHDRFGFIKRLRHLMLKGLIERPPQVNPKDVHTHFKVYALTKKGKTALSEKGLLNKYAVPTTGDFPHMIMAACITANIELGCKAAGFRYISQEEILAKANPEKYPLTLKTTIPKNYIDKKGKAVSGYFRIIPDQLFGIDYGDNTCRFFAVEADRGSYTQGTLKETVEGYQDVIGRQTYKTKWSIPNLLVLIVTTAETRADNLLESVSSKFILTNWLDGFKPYDKPPVLHPKLFGKYKRAGDHFDITRA